MSEKQIKKLLEKVEYGLTIEEVSQELEISRTTASKYLAVLAAKEEILVREVGKAKLHYPQNGNSGFKRGKIEIKK